MNDLTYQSPPPPHRAWIKSLLLVIAACPFLLLAVITFVHVSDVFTDPGITNAGAVLVQLVVGAVLIAGGGAIAYRLLSRADPSRFLPPPAPGESPAPCTFFSRISLAFALLDLLMALLSAYVTGLFLRLHFFHADLPVTLLMRLLLAVFLLLPVAVLSCALIDIITMAASPVRRRGYRISCAALAFICAPIPVADIMMARGDAACAVARVQREEAVRSIRTFASIRFFEGFTPDTDKTYLYPEIPQIAVVDLFRRPTPAANALILALRREPLPAIPTLYENPSTGLLEYAHEGYLVYFADNHTDTILPSRWPAVWSAHNAARAALSLPPQPDPLAPQ